MNLLHVLTALLLIRRLSSGCIWGLLGWLQSARTPLGPASTSGTVLGYSAFMGTIRSVLPVHQRSGAPMHGSRAAWLGSALRRPLWLRGLSQPSDSCSLTLPCRLRR